VPAVKLELNIIEIKSVRFDAGTYVNQGHLCINRQELVGLLNEDKRLTDINIELAHPGESCRIIRVADIIEPRAKMDEGGQDFPGAVGKQASAGQGKTCVLRGAAVALSECNIAGKVTLDQIGDVIDMSGPAAEASQYGKTCNIVVLAAPAAGVSSGDYRVALKIAGLKAAAYLAKAGKDVPADAIEVYNLDLMERTAQNISLPRVVYISQVLTNQYEPVAGDPVLYGDNIERTVPTVLHPNEVMDGAVVVPLGNFFVETYLIQNHPIVKELYRNHGKTLYFAGVIITNAPNNVGEFERAANMAANLAKWVLDADGAILTKTGGGAPELTMARTAQRCEELGIKTALALLHMGIDTTDTNYQPSVIFNAPEVNAMVSMGAPIGAFKLLPVNRIIGPPATPQVSGEIVKGIRNIKGSLSQVGNSRVTAAKY
jgi:sarcosine reductase